MNREIIQENLSLTGILNWLSETYAVKKTNKNFSLQDAQGYVNRGYVPKYMGGHLIVRAENRYTKLYNIINSEGKMAKKIKNSIYPLFKNRKQV